MCLCVCVFVCVCKRTETGLIAHDDEIDKLEKNKESMSMQEVLTRVDTYQELLNERDTLRDATRQQYLEGSANGCNRLRLHQGIHVLHHL